MCVTRVFLLSFVQRMSLLPTSERYEFSCEIADVFQNSSFSTTKITQIHEDTRLTNGDIVRY